MGHGLASPGIYGLSSTSLKSAAGSTNGSGSVPSRPTSPISIGPPPDPVRYHPDLALQVGIAVGCGGLHTAIPLAELQKLTGVSLS